MSERTNGFTANQEPEPATFAYIRRGAIGWGLATNDQIEEVLKNNNLQGVGSTLVDTLGPKITIALADIVGQLAQGALEQRPDDRVARNALRWSNRANKRITEHGWQNPGEPTLTYHGAHNYHNCQ